MNNYVVYCHTLKEDGRKYIGITCQKTKNRWRHDGAGYKTCIHFYRAIKKYGWDSFNHQVLFNNLTKEEAEAKEIELIKKHNTTNEKYGFNVLNGGNTRKDFHHTQEAKDKISKALKGIKPHNKGIPMCEEQKQKISEANKGKKISKEQIRIISLLKSKKVKCIELNIVFDNERKASEFINGNKHICDVCKGKRTTAGGYHWQYI